MEDNKSTTVKKMVKSGITFGSALAMVISYKNLMDYLVGCMSYIFFCVTNFKFNEEVLYMKKSISRNSNVEPDC